MNALGSPRQISTIRIKLWCKLFLVRWKAQPYTDLFKISPIGSGLGQRKGKSNYRDICSFTQLEPFPKPSGLTKGCILEYHRKSPFTHHFEAYKYRLPDYGSWLNSQSIKNTQYLNEHQAIRKPFISFFCSFFIVVLVLTWFTWSIIVLG